MQESRKKEIRIKAADFREKCKVGRYGIMNLFRECDSMGYKLLRYPLGDTADLGFALRKEQDIVIFTNSSYRLSREIFTLAHEIGHVLLHLHQVASFIDTQITLSDKVNDIREEEANFFAASLLMPAEEVDRFLDLEVNDFRENGLSAMDIARLMSEFNVSYDMALNRLENLGKIDGKQHKLLDNEKCEKRVGNLLRAVGGNAKLNQKTEEKELPYEYIEYVIYNYNHNAVPKETVEKVLACYDLKMEDIADSLQEPKEEEENLDLLIGGLED